MKGNIDSLSALHQKAKSYFLNASSSSGGGGVAFSTNNKEVFHFDNDSEHRERENEDIIEKIKQLETAAKLGHNPFVFSSLPVVNESFIQELRQH